MTEKLYLRLGDHRVEWILLDNGSGEVRLRGEGEIAEFADLTREITWSGGTHVLLRTEEALLTHAAVPSRQRRQILQALPYMVEEDLATDVEACHFAVGPRNEAGEVSVAVIDKARLSWWLERLAEAGIRPASVTPDALHVPAGPGTSLLVDGNRAIFRTGPFSGFGMELELLPTAMGLLDASHLGSLRVYIHPAQRQDFQLYLSQIEAEFPGEIEVEEISAPPFEFLCRGFDASSIDLLQGEFEVAEDRQENGNSWRSAAILAACALGLHLMLTFGQGIYLDVKAQQYAREAAALYTAVFPADRNVRDVRGRWQAHLAVGRGQATGAFFDVFTETARYLPGSDLVLENVNFNESRGDLILQLAAPRYDQFDLFAQTLRKSGLVAEIGTINQDADTVKGSIKVRSLAGN